MKTCSQCKVEKPLTEFHRMAKSRDGVRSSCKLCTRKASKSWSKRSDHDKEYYQRNKTRIREQTRAWREQNPQYAAEYGKKYHQTPIKRAKFIWTKAKIRHHGPNFVSLHRIEVALMIGVCERTGISFDFKPHPKYQRNPFGPSIDKIDPFGEYTNENIQVVCNAYNCGKHQMTDKEFVDFCRKVVQTADERA